MSISKYAGLTDATLAALTAKGDESAFEEISLRYIKLIYSLSTNYRLDGYETQDFVQEGMLAFLHAARTYNEGCGASFKNYAVKCVRNRFNDILKKGNSKSRASLVVPIDDIRDTLDDAQNVEDFVLEREYLQTLFDHVRKTLTEEERLVFDMYTQGYSYREIAEETGSTSKQVDNLLQKIKRKLRK